MAGRFRDKFQNFMSGRYGMDEFGRFLGYVSIGVMVVALILGFFTVTAVRIVSWVFWGIALAILIYNYFRMFSRNFGARNAENQWFCNIRYKNQGGAYGHGNYSYGNYNGYNNSYGSQTMTNEQKKAMDRRTHKIFKCPNCSQKIRVPKHRGRICIKCPKCRIEFIKKT